ncbi:MAG: hypothetical protein J6Y45_00930 [Bacteroidales bacterium]|nr:hypothetical protein [Bacteroidales bacterium]
MRRRICILFCLLLCCSTAFAGENGGRVLVRWGLDWGYGLDVYKYWNINYSDSQVGDRVIDQDATGEAFPNAYFTAKVGLEVTRWLEVSVFSGLMGISEDRKIIPAALQASYFPFGCASSGPMATVAGGMGFNTDFTLSPSVYGMIGGGWRFYLNPVWNLDLILRARISKDAPPVWDRDNNTVVTPEYVRKNVVITGALEFGIALTF